MDHFKKWAFWPLTALVLILFLGFAFSGITLINQAEADQGRPPESRPPTVQSNRVPKENCEQYRDQALKILEQVETTGEGLSHRNLMIAIQYLGRAQKATLEYQSCVNDKLHKVH